MLPLYLHVNKKSDDDDEIRIYTVGDLPFLQQASYLEGGPLMWMLPLYLHVNKKSDDDDEIRVYTVSHTLSTFLVHQKVVKFGNKILGQI